MIFAHLQNSFLFQSKKWRWQTLWWLLGMLLFLVLGQFHVLPTSLENLFSPIIAVDLNQHRLDTALPAPQGQFTIQQTFTPHRDGLREIELLLVRWDETQNGRFWLKLYDDGGNPVAEEWINSRGIVHNQTYVFRFPVQAHSASRQYKLEMGGSPTNPLSVWGYSLDVMGNGRLQLIPAAGETLVGDADVPETAVQDIRFTTRYQLTLATAWHVLEQVWRQQGRYLLLAIAFIPLPGCLLLQWYSPHSRWDMVAWWGTAYALGAATWPLIWHALTLVGGYWRGWSLWLVFIVGWIMSLFLWLRSRQQARRGKNAQPLITTPKTSLSTYIFLSLLILGLGLRLLAVRDINVPPWVDAGRHALITNVMMKTGQTPSDYASILPIDRFPYHFGFHTLSASLGLMTTWALPDLLLYLGQLLNALIPLTVYTAVWLVSRRTRASVLAAFLVAVPFFFPAYYAAWGRFTQLAAMLIMPVLLALTWLLVRGGRVWKQAWWLVSILAAGLFLMHIRVFLFYIPFVALVWLVGWGRHGRFLAAAAAFALLLVTPRVWELWNSAAPTQAVSYNIAGYNAFPVSYLRTGWEIEIIWLAAACMPLLLLAAFRRRAWAIFPSTLVVWVAILFLLLSGNRLGLPETTLVNMNSMYITLFVPLALFLSIVLSRVWHWWERLPLLLTIPGYILAGMLLAATLLFGSQQQITILNEQTILIYPSDREALVWAAANLPDTAKVAVNSWVWLGNTWAGSDGGAWIVQLAHLQSTTPPADYDYSQSLFTEVNTFNEKATAVSDWSDPQQIDWLHSQGVTHIFVGVRGGFFDPAALARNPELQILYAQDGVFIFQLPQ